MLRHRVFRYLALGLGTSALVACGDTALPTSPSAAKSDIQTAPAAPVNAAFSRYILISGVWVCVDCGENGK
jgi:hypothetical protein